MGLVPLLPTIFLQNKGAGRDACTFLAEEVVGWGLRFLDLVVDGCLDHRLHRRVDQACTAVQQTKWHRAICKVMVSPCLLRPQGNVHVYHVPRFGQHANMTLRHIFGGAGVVGGWGLGVVGMD